jgi:hypothetical protein
VILEELVKVFPGTGISRRIFPFTKILEDVAVDNRPAVAHGIALEKERGRKCFVLIFK